MNSLTLTRTRWVPVTAAVAVILTAVSFLVAQTSPPQTNRVVIRASRLLEAKTGRWLPDQRIYIEGDKIARIEAGAPKTAPEWTVIELGNAAVLPGLIDCHVHLTISPSSFGYELLGISEARQTLTGAANARKTLLAGFTTVRNVGALGFLAWAMRSGRETVHCQGTELLIVVTAHRLRLAERVSRSIYARRGNPEATPSIDRGPASSLPRHATTWNCTST